MGPVKRILIAAWILLIPFQDSGIQRTPLGYLGASPAFIPLSALIFVSALEWCLAWRHLKLNRNVLLVVCYALAVNLIYLIPNELRTHGTNIIAKTFSLSVLTWLFLFPVFFIDYSGRRLGSWVKAAFWVTVVGVVLTDMLSVQSVSASPLIHYHPNLNLRPRGFCMESSTLAAMLITLGLLSAHFSKGSMPKTVYIALTGALVVYSGSKGGAITFFVLALLIILPYLRSRRWLAFAIIPAWACASYYVYTFAAARFAEDIASFASTATRTGLMVTTVLTVLHNPFGVGFSGFLAAIDRYVPMASQYISSVSGVRVNLAELLSYAGSGTTTDISTKTLLFDYLVFFGWPFLFIFVSLHYKLVAGLWANKRKLLLVLVIYTLVATCAYVQPLGLYNISLVYGVAFYAIRRQNDIGSLA